MICVARTAAAVDGREARRSRRVGFTLLEILLTLAIIAAMAAVLVSGTVRLTEMKPVSPQEIFWKAVQETRKRALRSGAEQQLRMTGKNHSLALVATGPGGDKTYSFNATSDLQVDFLASAKSRSAILIGGQLIETGSVPFVTFYGDGTCSPFRVQFHSGAGAAFLVSIDPWTCAPVLISDDSHRL